MTTTWTDDELDPQAALTRYVRARFSAHAAALVAERNEAWFALHEHLAAGGAEPSDWTCGGQYDAETMRKEFT